MKWIALVGHMGQGFLMGLSANELRIILTHDFKLMEEFAVALVVDFGWQKEVMSVWRKDGRGGGRGRSGFLKLRGKVREGAPVGRPL